MLENRTMLVTVAALVCLGTPARAEPMPPPATVRLGDLDLAPTEQVRRKVLAHRAFNDKPLVLAGRTFDNGVGTQSYGVVAVDLGGTAQRFTAMVGVDDQAKGLPGGTVEFQIYGDGKRLWSSGLLHAGAPPKPVDLPLADVHLLLLVVTDGGDGITNDHADWADAKIVFAGPRPRVVPRPREEAVILTPKASPAPRLNGARVFGVRPGSPVLFTVAATGERPLTFTARGLPKGLMLDKKTGRITGQVAAAGEHAVSITARNRLGKATRGLRIVVGDKIALTPPMGWNSWNVFGGAVTADKVKAAADAMVKSGLVDHGWQYVNIDDYWEVHRDSKDPTLQGPQRDAQGRVLPNPRFPDMAGLVSYIHGLGLRAGLYSSPGPWTCGGCVGSYEHEEQDAARYAEWGFDYLKYDWCSYKTIAKDKSLTTLQAPYKVMRDALLKQKRDIVFSLCQYGLGDVWEWGESVGGHLWRTTGDIHDSWGSMASIAEAQAGHERFAGPGHWNDPDMLVVGQVGWSDKTRPTKLTPNEQYTHISLWALLAAPLLIGADMTKLDDFTLGLLTNDEVIEVDQDPLGRQAARVWREGPLEIWSKAMEDGSRAVGLFNMGYLPARVTAKWTDLGVSGRQRVRDLWRQSDLGVFDEQFAADVPVHGVTLVRMSALPVGKKARDGQ